MWNHEGSRGRRGGQGRLASLPLARRNPGNRHLYSDIDIGRPLRRAPRARQNTPRRWYPTHEIGWYRTHEIRWSPTDEIGWVRTEEILHLSLKAALPSSSAQFSWAGLAGVTFATGQDPFTAARALYSLAVATSLKLNDTYSTGLYINLNYSDGRSGYTLSPNLNFVLSDNLSAYVEAGYNHVPQSPDTTIAGSGLAWMVAPTVQLDLSMDIGLTRDSPDIQGGFGVSSPESDRAALRGQGEG